MHRGDTPPGIYEVIKVTTGSHGKEGVENRNDILVLRLVQLKNPKDGETWDKEEGKIKNSFLDYGPTERHILRWQLGWVSSQRGPWGRVMK